jgi:CxxC motif-containing protein (DUF1111 family)
VIAWLVGCTAWLGGERLSYQYSSELGGAATVQDASVHAYALAIRGLSRADQRAFSVGNAFFNDNWVIAPASTTARDGLGPLFNARSCSSCHFKDGRAEPAEGRAGLLLRLRIEGEGVPVGDPIYGGQIQDLSILPDAAEAKVRISVTNEEVVYPDGTTRTLHVPTYTLSELNYGELDERTVMSPRIAPAVFGLGLLSAVPLETLKRLEDPDDSDGNGISGRINRLADGRTGRFGWKADVSSLAEQTAGAFVHDMGITSSTQPNHPHTVAQQELDAQPSGGSPEIDDPKFTRIVQYLERLAVPSARNVDSLEVRRGRRTFIQLGCANCHVPSLQTGESEVAQLAHQRIQPYTDLLLHDMGPMLADGFASHDATGQEWRTPPLWGLGLLSVVNGHTRLLHDGRAHSVEEAILWHGGEGERSKMAFMSLDATERGQVLAFLNSL